MMDNLCGEWDEDFTSRLDGRLTRDRIDCIKDFYIENDRKEAERLQSV